MTPAQTGPFGIDMDTVLLFILDVLTLGTLILLALIAIGTVRDLLYNLGFSKKGGWIERSYVSKSEVRAFAESLSKEAIGTTVKSTLSEYGIPPRLLRKLHKTEGLNPGQRPDAVLVENMPRWLRDLGSDRYKGMSFYIDMMDAMVNWRDGAADPRLLQQIMSRWLRALREAGVLEYDVLLTSKRGNVSLAVAVAEDLGHSLIVAKGPGDKSGIPPTGGVHTIDMEGMTSFRSSLSELKHGRTLHVVYIDDSCAGGSQLRQAIARFNEYVTKEGLNDQIHPVRNAVTLFRFVPRELPSDWNEALKQQSIQLHALVAIGEAQAARLSDAHERPIAVDALSFFKADEYACARSLELFASS